MVKAELTAGTRPHPDTAKMVGTALAMVVLYAQTAPTAQEVLLEAGLTEHFMLILAHIAMALLGDTHTQLRTQQALTARIAVASTTVVRQATPRRTNLDYCNLLEGP